MKVSKGSNKKNIFFNTIWMLFDKVFILLLNLFVTVKIANYYGKDNYGLYQYAISIVALFEILVTFVDGRVVKKRYPSDNGNEIVWNATVARLFFSVVSLLAGCIYLFFLKESEGFNKIFIILLINAIIINLRFGMQSRYEYLLKSKKVIIASNIGLSLGGILQIIAVSFKLPIITIAIITVISSFLSLSIIYIQYRADYGKMIGEKYNLELLKRLVIESLPFAIAASCAIVYSRCDSIMIGNMLSKSDVGVYAIAVKMITVVQIAISPISESVYSKMIELYKYDKKQYAIRYVQVTSLLTWIYIIGVGISFLILPYAFHFLNKEYALAFPIYQVYVIGTFFMYNAALRAGHYTLIDRGNILMYSQMICVILNIFLNYILINLFGIYGAAYATVVTQGISLFLSNLFFKKEGREVFFWQVKALNPIKIFK